MIPLGWVVGLASFAITYIAAALAHQHLIAGGFWFKPAFFHELLFRYLIPYLVMVAFFTFVYKVIPTRKISFNHALAGSALFSALMEFAKHFFVWYVARFTSYDLIYGSLGTIVLLVIWGFYVSMILLFCAELVYSHQRRDILLLEKAFTKTKYPNKRAVSERMFRKFGRFYPRDCYVFREGDKSTEMYYVLAGHVEIEKQAGETKKTLAEIGPGAYFGEMATLINVPRTASARVTEDSELAVINAEIFHNLLRDSANVSILMLQEFSHRIRNSNQALENATRCRLKLAALLYFLKSWPLKENQDAAWELSKCFGKEKSEVQEILQDLRKEGVLQMDEGQVSGFSRDRAWNLVETEI